MMAKTMYVAVGLALIGGATLGAPRLVSHGLAAHSRVRPQDIVGYAEAEAATRAEGMQRNYDAIQHLIAEVEYKQVTAEDKTTRRFLMKYVAPQTAYFEDLSTSFAPATADYDYEATMPRIRTWTDGREIRLAAVRGDSASSAEEILTAQILPAAGNNTDRRGFDGRHPLSAIRGSGPIVINWKQLRTAAESGRTLRAGPERQFGVRGFGFLFEDGNKRDLYYWIDDVHGFLPRIVTYRSAGKNTMELRIETVAKAGDAWIPTHMTRRVEHEDGSTIQGDMRVLSFDADTKLSPEDLELQFPPGTLVIDHIRSTQYTVEQQ
ncbi:MAG: hypothetical protein JSV65_00405 [Armatimonadota bacterium]|nr:MAG: hypothetical protein JSV65_00405 [Armatimonadota bacterium]